MYRSGGRPSKVFTVTFFHPDLNQLQALDEYIIQCLFQLFRSPYTDRIIIMHSMGNLNEVNLMSHRRLSAYAVMCTVIEDDMDIVVWMFAADDSHIAHVHDAGPIAIEAIDFSFWMLKCYSQRYLRGMTH